MEALTDFILHYGDSDHLFFVPQARDAEDAMRYFFCIEGYGQSRTFGTMDPGLCLVVPLFDYLRDRDAVEARIEQIRRRARALQDARDGLLPVVTASPAATPADVQTGEAAGSDRR